MTPLALYFIHGWGYDRSFWHLLCKNLPEIPCFFYEAGYFGASPDITPPQRPYLAVGHSAGVMTALSHNDDFCRGLIAFNGFSRFTHSPSFPQGVPERILQRMILRLGQSPETTLRQFRTLCGENDPTLPSIFEKTRLQAGLEFLRDGDSTASLAQWSKPLINITGSQDPLSPAQAGLLQPATSPLWENFCWDGGHLLPITHLIASARLIGDIHSRIGASSL